MKKIDAATVLRYWAEPGILYYVKDLICWQDDKDVFEDNKKSLGYFPVYESREEAEDAHPGSEVLEIMIVPVTDH